VKQWPEKVFSTVMMGTLKYLRLPPIGSNTKSPHGLIPCYRNSLRKPEHALQPSGDRRFSLMNQWFYSMIGFGRAAQVQEGNENVV